MDEVQTFIARNQHQFGYIMQEASRQWIAKDPVGALTVGVCNLVIQKHGQYHEILEKLEKREQEIEQLKESLVGYMKAVEIYSELPCKEAMEKLIEIIQED